MRQGREPGGGRLRAAQARPVESRRGPAPEPVSEPVTELDRKYWLAMALYGLLALLAWFTMGPEKVMVMGRPVEMRWVPLLVLGGLALRTTMARHAEKIRSSGEKGSQ